VPDQAPRRAPPLLGRDRAALAHPARPELARPRRRFWSGHSFHGLDWATFDDCDENWQIADCGADFIWVPVVAQWNFFLTPVVSVFGEPGAAFLYRTWDFDGACPIFDEDECDDSDFDPFEPVFFAGGRFLFSDNIGLVVRLGTPYVSLGATFLM
jgi:hypothetical protein